MTLILLFLIKKNTDKLEALPFFRSAFKWSWAKVKKKMEGKDSKERKKKEKIGEITAKGSSSFKQIIAMLSSGPRVLKVPEIIIT